MSQCVFVARESDPAEGRVAGSVDTVKKMKALGLDGNTLVICIHWESGRGAVKGNRPTALESKEGSSARLITLKRQKQ